jgi:hypothetical protein
VVPWLSEELPEWGDLTDEERQAVKNALRALGLNVPGSYEEEDDYFE